MAIQFKAVEKPKRGRPKTGLPPKVLITLRIDPDVIDGFKSTGEGWQSRINAVLRDHLHLPKEPK